MKNKVHILTLMLAVLLLTGCNLIDDTVVDDDTPVEVSLSFSVANAKQTTTRQANNVVQASSNFRRLTNWLVIPFEVRERKIEAEDLAKRERLGRMEKETERDALAMQSLFTPILRRTLTAKCLGYLLSLRARVYRGDGTWSMISTTSKNWTDSDGRRGLIRNHSGLSGRVYCKPLMMSGLTS